MRYLPKMKTAGEMRGEEAEASLRIRDAQKAVVEANSPPPKQFNCDTCGKEALGGRQPSKLKVGSRVCTECYNKELEQLLRAFKQGGRT